MSNCSAPQQHPSGRYIETETTEEDKAIKVIDMFVREELLNVLKRGLGVPVQGCQ